MNSLKVVPTSGSGVKFQRVDQADKTVEGSHFKESFSTARDFALLLSIPYIGAVGFLIKHYFQYQNAPKPVDLPWFNQFWAFDTGLWSHILSFIMLTGGLGLSVYFLHRVDKLKKWDESQNS